MRPLGPLSLLLALALGHSAPARAESDVTVSYGYQRVWPAAVRFLRIDEGHAIIEKDAEAGYVLFDVADKPARKSSRGALELVRVGDRGKRDQVRLVLRISGSPSYLEQAMLERLTRKLRNELGEPSRPHKDPPPPKDPASKDPAP